jgi:DNA (cytosine-5)-methyltransferase 1
MKNSEKNLITIKEAAVLLGVTPLTLRNWDRKGKLTALRHPINNYRVYRLTEIQALIELMNTNKKPTQATYTKSRKKLQVVHLD